MCSALGLINQRDREVCPRYSALTFSVFQNRIATDAENAGARTIGEVLGRSGVTPVDVRYRAQVFEHEHLPLDF